MAPRFPQCGNWHRCRSSKFGQEKVRCQPHVECTENIRPLKERHQLGAVKSSSVCSNRFGKTGILCDRRSSEEGDNRPFGEGFKNRRHALVGVGELANHVLTRPGPIPNDMSCDRIESGTGGSNDNEVGAVTRPFEPEVQDGESFLQVGSPHKDRCCSIDIVDLCPWNHGGGKLGFKPVTELGINVGDPMTVRMNFERA